MIDVFILCESIVMEPVFSATKQEVEEVVQQIIFWTLRNKTTNNST